MFLHGALDLPTDVDGQHLEELNGKPARLVAFIFLKGGTTADKETRKNAEELQQYMPDKTVDEIIEIGQQDVTDEQEKIFNEIMSNYDIPDPDTITIVSTPEDQDLSEQNPAIIYKDAEGNIHIQEIPEDIYNMTDEEAEENTRLLFEEMDEIVANHENNNNESNNNQENQNNPSNNQVGNLRRRI